MGSFPYQRLITMPKFLVVIGKLDKLLPCQQVLGPVGRRQHCWPTTPSIVGCYMLRPIEKSTIKTRTLSSAQRLKTHVRVSLSRVHVNQQQKNRKRRHMSVCTPCCMLLLVVACTLLGIVAQGFNPVKLLSQKIPKFLLFPVFPDRRSLALQCCRLHCSFNTIGVTHAHYTWSAKYYGLYPSHDALHVPALLKVVASVCTSLPTWTQ